MQICRLQELQDDKALPEVGRTRPRVGRYVKVSAVGIGGAMSGCWRVDLKGMAEVMDFILNIMRHDQRIKLRYGS